MLKSISAALLAVSVLAAPAFAASEAKTAPAPVTKSAQAPVATTTAKTVDKTADKTAIKTTQAPVIKAEQVKAKPAVLNANARMGRHHVRHYRHHRFHRHVGAAKTHGFSKVSSKHITPTAKRG